LERTSESAVGLQNGYGQILTFTDALSAAHIVQTSDIIELLAERELQRLEKKVSEQITKAKST